jgi:hypothetical protein
MVLVCRLFVIAPPVLVAVVRLYLTCWSRPASHPLAFHRHLPSIPNSWDYVPSETSCTLGSGTDHKRVWLARALLMSAQQSGREELVIWLSVFLLGGLSRVIYQI